MRGTVESGRSAPSEQSPRGDREPAGDSARVPLVLVLLWFLVGLVPWVLLVGFSLLGLYELGHALVTCCCGVLEKQSEASTSPGIAMALRGLEMLFLAPLAWLTLVCMLRYIESFKKGPGLDELARAIGPMHEVKGQIIGLMIAVVSTEMVRRVLGPDELAYSFIAGGLGLILVLTLYLHTLRHSK